MSDEKKEKILERVVLINYQKYGVNNIKEAICDYLETGNLKGFTNTGNSRKMVADNFNELEMYYTIFNFLKKSNYQVDQSSDFKTLVTCYLSALNLIIDGKVRIIPKEKDKSPKLVKTDSNLKEDNELIPRNIIEKVKDKYQDESSVEQSINNITVNHSKKKQYNELLRKLEELKKDNEALDQEIANAHLSLQK